ncbi:hypothetical protein I553_2685 [Mycobacterium xenopi 4042]|uniref:Uncharacterized protein n=1 Tax=Mycobacterium xenopi 4042 TaxID=1299334 RepID=X7Z1N8_MYCXE|nr:hypothetical protein I553_2685 [Mycobacterium xenopi 4042]
MQVKRHRGVTISRAADTGGGFAAGPAPPMAAWSMAAARTRGRHGSRDAFAMTQTATHGHKGDYGIDGAFHTISAPAQGAGSP